MPINSSRLFLESATRDFKRTGAVAPSSKALAQSMTRQIDSGDAASCRVLEVGGGTGAVTESICERLSRGGRIDVYEIDEKLAGLLRRRFDGGTQGRRRAAVRVYHRPIEEIESGPEYDYVLSCLPFTNFTPEGVRRIFELYRSVLKPGGICSFYEYILVRKAVRLMAGDAGERDRVEGVSSVVREYIDRYGFEQNVVLRNLPPATVHHIRFQPPI